MNPTAFRRQLLICAAGLAFALPGYAADAAPARSGLAQALEQAWRLHPEAAALEGREAEARAQRDIALGLTPEPGSLSIGSRSDRL
ncbi:MAG: hypothetical protein U1A72_19260, partial [Sulfuritalea sp.]|nr:hypothetical protein [Sulfuritalea sp.]